MKTLYITDLDGTILNKDKCIPAESLEILNALIKRGLLFSYATARSIVSAAEVTKGLNNTTPVITGNGVSIVNPQTREIVSTMAFAQEDLSRLIDYMRRYNLYPLVYSYIDGQEKCSWVRGKETQGLLGWLSDPVRKVDTRLNPVNSFEELFQGQVFYMTCMGHQEDFAEIDKELQQDECYRHFLTEELYDDSYWLEIMPLEATKSKAALKLKEMLGCDRMVCFGDGINDMSIFQVADECYAMENAVDELKAIATGVIGSNEEGSVVKWLEEYAELDNNIIRKLPQKIVDLIAGENYTLDDIGKSSSTVMMLADKVLKVQRETDETKSERMMLRWLEGKLPVPKVLCEVSDGDTSYLLMSRIPGKMTCDAEYMENPQMLVSVLAEGLKRLWEVDITGCPQVWDLDRKLAQAKEAVENGEVDVDDAEPETFGSDGFKNPQELWQWLDANRPAEDMVLSHGDFCLPNIFVQDGKVSGYIDLGRMGVADKWQDIAICYRSLKHNFCGKYAAKVYEDFYPDMLFEALGMEPDWEKLRYYILLDELF